MDLNECIDVLRKIEVAAVVARWNTVESDGDGGFTDNLEFFDKDNKDVSDRIDERLESVKLEDVDTYELDEEITGRLAEVIERIDPDYTDDMGSWGQLRLDVRAGKVTCEFNKGVRASQKTEHTVSFSNENDVPTSRIIEEACVKPMADAKLDESDEEPKSTEPECTCANLLRGHEANCLYWQNQQRTGSAR